MRYLAAILAALVLAVTVPARADHDTLPKDREIPLVLADDGTPISVSPKTWALLDYGEYERCLMVLVTDGVQQALVFALPEGEGYRTVFYVIGERDAVIEWAGNPHYCGPAEEV